MQTLLEAAEAVIDEWYYTQQNVTLNYIGEKIVDLKNAIAREKCKSFRNCDKYMTANDALSAFMQMCKERECITCPFEYGRKYPFSCHFNWLYEDSRFKWVHAEDRKEA